MSLWAGAGEGCTLDLHFRSPTTGSDARVSLSLPQLRTALGTSQRAVFAITAESCADIILDVVRVPACAPLIEGAGSGTVHLSLTYLTSRGAPSQCFSSSLFVWIAVLSSVN